MDHETNGLQSLSFYEANRSAFLWFGAGLSVMLAAAVIGLAYSLGTKEAEKSSSFTLLADNTPLKTRPANPGGVTYPYQGMSVYQNENTEDLDNISLKTPTEQPLKRTPAEEEALKLAEKQLKEEKLKSANNFSAFTPQNISPVKPSEKPQKSDSVEDIILNATPKAENANRFYNENLLMAKKEEPPVPPIAKIATDARGGPSLQLGAYRSDSEAKAAWRKISASGGISGYSPNILKADLKDRGVFYRLRVGPFQDRNEATALCDRLKSKSQPCMYIP